MLPYFQEPPSDGMFKKWLLKLGRVFTFRNVVRDFTYLDVAVLSESPSDGMFKM